MRGLLEQPQQAPPSSHCGLLQALLPQDLDEEVDIPHSQAQRLILTEFLVRRVGGDELPQLGEGAVDILLPPPLSGVGEDLSGHP